MGYLFSMVKNQLPLKVHAMQPRKTIILRKPWTTFLLILRVKLDDLIL